MRSHKTDILRYLSTSTRAAPCSILPSFVDSCVSPTSKNHQAPDNRASGADQTFAGARDGEEIQRRTAATRQQGLPQGGYVCFDSLFQSGTGSLALAAMTQRKKFCTIAALTCGP